MPEDEQEDLERGQDGQGGDDLGAGDDDLGALSEVELNIEDFETPEGKEPKDKGGDAKDKAKGGEEKPPEDDERDTLKRERDDLLRKNKDLNRALHAEREGRKGKDKGGDGDGAPTLTDAQLRGLMHEYKDDPDTLYNIIKHTAEQAAGKAGKQAVDDAETRRAAQESEAFVTTNYPDAADPESELGGQVARAVDKFGLGAHPHRQILGTAVTALLALPNLLKEAHERGKKEATTEAAEKDRQRQVEEKANPPSRKPAGGTPGGNGTKELSATEKDVAKRLGLKNPRQQELLRQFTRSRANITVGR